MSLLALSGLGLTRGLPLFTGLDLALAKGDRLGLVAANGRGKSSLFHVLSADEEPTEGTITRARGLKTALVPQEVPEALRRATLRAVALSTLDPATLDWESWRAEIALDDLGVPEELRDRPMDALSGGWQRMALLARAAVAEPDLVLMDEPTNHLDLARIGTLEAWIAGLPRDTALIAASHDRAFLDAVTTRTLFLRPEGSRAFAVPYGRARVALDEADAFEAQRHETEMKKAAQLRRQAAKLKNIGINSGSDLLTTKTRQLTDRAERIEEAAKPAHAERSAGAIRLDSTGTHARALVSIAPLEVTVPDGTALFRVPQLWIEPGDRVALLGPNGAGKSRFLALVRAAIDGGVPEIRAAATLRLGESDQSLSRLDRFATPWEAVTHSFDGGDARARALLAQSGLRVDQQTGPIAALSGGQRARLAMLLLRLDRPNFYLLDEPTNHLDIEGQEALEAELTAQDAACLMVSHDRAFVRAVATRVWSVEGRRLVEVGDSAPVFDRLMAG